jgi:hypothetical protein
VGRDVRDSLTDQSTTRVGRVFSYVLSLFTGGNGLPVNATTYAVTTDGFRYRIDQRGMDPNGWVEYGSQLGFLDPNGTTPHYHDALANNSGTPGQLTSVAGGVIFAPPRFPIFFTPPANATLTALGIPLTPIASLVTNVSFAGTVVGSTTLFQSGGTFSYTSNVGGVYQIVVSRDGVNFDPTDPQNRVLSGLKGAGTQTVGWDGKNNSGNYFPVNTGGTSYPFKIDVRAGEYHFPFVDVENDTQGGPTLTMLKSAGRCLTALHGWMQRWLLRRPRLHHDHGDPGRDARVRALRSQPTGDRIQRSDHGVRHRRHATGVRRRQRRQHERAVHGQFR